MMLAAARACLMSLIDEQSQAERLVRQEAEAGIDRQAADLLGGLGRDFLDVDAAGRAHHEDRPLGVPVHDQTDIGLGGDLGRRHHEDLVDHQALDASCRGSSRRAALASAGVLASLTPPALPRPPAWTWALTTTVPPMRRAMASASDGVEATSPSGMGMPAALSSARAWYS